MPLAKRWHDLNREAVGRAPNRYGMVEFGTDGDVERIEAGVVRDVLKEGVAYGNHEQVRWEAAEHREHAERLADEHRERL